MFLSKGGKYTLDRDDFVSIVGEGQRTNTERQCGEVVVGQIGSVVGKVEGKCRERSGIRWRVTSGGIARDSGAVAIGVGVDRVASDGVWILIW